jgi:ERCC4-type nuclease
VAAHRGVQGGLGLLIYHKGAAAAIQIKEISEYTKLSDRAVKDAVRSLIVDFKVRIAGSRQEPYGYYLVMTAEEARAAASPLVHEALDLLQRAEVLTDEHFITEQNGQMRIEIPKVTSPDAVRTRSARASTPVSASMATVSQSIRPQNATAGRKMAADYNKQFGHVCEDCGDRDASRRRRCKACGLLVCGWCFNHVHAINHSR